MPFSRNWYSFGHKVQRTSSKNLNQPAIAAKSASIGVHRVAGPIEPRLFLNPTETPIIQDRLTYPRTTLRRRILIRLAVLFSLQLYLEAKPQGYTDYVKYEVYAEIHAAPLFEASDRMDPKILFASIRRYVAFADVFPNLQAKLLVKSKVRKALESQPRTGPSLDSLRSDDLTTWSGSWGTVGDV
ncbi:hypothetical protein EVAR_76630_1 [Eumeta japonica]|uniref:Uncharacterized protein n=1 Tax=Eumeta variegata TaxID=151549 RepID=A0A4C1T639_EUMVA|nr:hypothetical protein EVAR_76630_1 [Eumeta japonica]